MKTLYRANERGGGDHGWLKTRHSFSFAHYYDPKRMNFGKLRVVNDDWIAPGAGFDTHHHSNMEIITIPLSGRVAHKDSAGGEGVVGAGEVQVMSAGTGVAHSEYNASKEEPLTLFQIWIETNSPNALPRYDQASFEENLFQNTFTPLVGPEGQAPLWIYQEAFISRGKFEAGKTFQYSAKNSENGIFLMVIEGKVKIDNQTVETRDAMEIINEGAVKGEALTSAEVLVIEAPLAI